MGIWPIVTVINLIAKANTGSLAVENLAQYMTFFLPVLTTGLLSRRAFEFKDENGSRFVAISKKSMGFMATVLLYTIALVLGVDQYDRFVEANIAFPALAFLMSLCFGMFYGAVLYLGFRIICKDVACRDLVGPKGSND